MKHNNETNPLLLDAGGVCDLLSIGKTLFYSMLSLGQIGPPSVKLGRRRLWRRADLEQWVKAGCPSRERWAAIERK